MKDATNASFLSIDLKDESKLKSLTKIDVGDGVTDSLKSREVKLTNSITFKKDCKQFLIAPSFCDHME